MLIKNGLEGYNQKASNHEKLISYFNIISGCSDFLKIANPTEERKQICKEFTERLVEYFDGLINSIDLQQLEKEIEKESKNEDYYSEDTIIDQAFELISQLSKIMFYNNSKIRFEAIRKIEELATILGKHNEVKTEIFEYMNIL